MRPKISATIVAQIHQLKQQGHAGRTIARQLAIAETTVRRILAAPIGAPFGAPIEPGQIPAQEPIISVCAAPIGAPFGAPIEPDKNTAHRPATSVCAAPIAAPIEMAQILADIHQIQLDIGWIKTKINGSAAKPRHNITPPQNSEWLAALKVLIGQNGSQAAVARLLGCVRSAISMWLAGQRVP